LEKEMSEEGCELFLQALHELKGDDLDKVLA
jgi:hypothetical protein